MTEAGSRGQDRSIPRLTVARASAVERRSVSELARCPVVDSRGLAERAADLAGERRGDRTAALQRAISARDRAADGRTLAASRSEELEARRDALRAGAAWAADAAAEVAAAEADLAAAEAEVQARQSAQRGALDHLDRVLEQRAAATAAMGDAETQLADLGVAELDESGLRRQLEASGSAVRTAQEVHAEAVATLQARQIDLSAATEELARAEAALAELTVTAVDTSGVDQVAVALDRWTDSAAGAGPDETAAALAEAWSDLQADLASVADTAPLPDPAVVAAAEARVQEASQHLTILEAATGSGPLSDAARAEIDEAHQAALVAEERSTRRIGGGTARRQLERARAHESELLSRHGFASYIDVVLTGGRPRHEAPELLQAARAYRNAVAERDALVAATKASPELTYLHGERVRLHQHCVDLLGVDPGDDVVALLRGHPAIPAAVVGELRDALAAVGVHPVGVSLASAAAAWLDHHRPTTVDAVRREDEQRSLLRRVEQLRDGCERLARSVSEAERAVADASTELERSTRSVSAFESELTMRADEDSRRLHRFAAAEQLRAQIESLARTLATAEDDARRALEVAAGAMASAESALDRAGANLSELQRRARTLLAEVPPDRRPEGDPLTVLPELAQALDAVVTGLEPEARELDGQLAVAEADLDETMGAVLAAEQALDGAQPEDHLDALRALLEESPGVVVLEEPLADAAVAPDVLCDILLTAGSRPVVLLTEDPVLLGWAIELPAEHGRVVPIDALNLGGEPADEETMERAILELSEQDSSPDVEAATPPEPRWAGRR